MAESHACDSPAEEERAKLEAEEFAAKVKRAKELLDSLANVLPNTILHMPGADVLVLVWYIQRLRDTTRQVDLMLYRDGIERTNARRSLTRLL